MKTQKRFTLSELTALTDISGRNIRYYIQKGIIDKPDGVNKGAYYTEKHLRQLSTVKKYKESGVSLERIAQIIHEDDQSNIAISAKKAGNIEVVSRILLDEGIELVVNPELSKLDHSQIRKLSKSILEQLSLLKEENNYE